MQLHSVVWRAPEATAAPVGREIVILNLARDDYVALDEIGRRVWELLEEPRPVSELCTMLMREFEAPAEQIEADILDFLRELEAEDLLRVTEPPS